MTCAGCSPTRRPSRLRQAYREPHQTPAELMRALLDAFPSGRVVVLLDNLEDVIDSQFRRFRDHRSGAG